MRFVLTGFTQNAGVRVFTFDRIAEDQTRTGFAVKADLALTRKYEIRLQELPLLCRRLLERRDDGEEALAFTFSEAEMILHSKSCAAEVELRQKKNSKHTPPGKEVGTAWRTPQSSAT